MPTSIRRPPPGAYTVHPLETLDGVLAYVALGGETVGYWFGRNEREAAQAVAAHLAPAGAAWAARED